MRLHQIINKPSIITTNEENDFIKHYGKSIYLGSLNEHDKIIARTLVRKGIYKIGNDNQTIIQND